METIKFDRVVSVNSETQSHTGQNLLNPEVNPKNSWQCEKGTDKAIIILQLERSSVIAAVRIGNAHSAFIEVLVGKASDDSDKYQSLIPTSTFMNPNESKTSKNPNQVRFFDKKDFDQEACSKQWDRVKVVCSQPFNKHVPYGVCFVEVLGEREESERKKVLPLLKDEEEAISIGSFFRKKKESAEGKELSVSEQIREAEKPSSLTKHTPLSTSKLAAKMAEKQSSSSKKSRRKLEDDDEQSDNRKNKDLGLEESTPKKLKLDDEPQKDTRSGRKRDGDRSRHDSKSKESDKKQAEKKDKDKKKEDKRKDGKKDRADEDKRKGKKDDRKRLGKPFSNLLEDVVLVISGFKNPLRGNLRSQAMEMGAKYMGDWDDTCTHLICAYENTPKFNQVKGQGKIVKKDWIEKCHKDRKRYPWRRYALDKDDRKHAESEDELDAASREEEDTGSTSEATGSTATDQSDKKAKGVRKAPSDEIYDVPTDEDEDEDKKIDTSDYPMPFLPDVFSLKTFYVDNNIDSRQTLERYIVAYNGIITETLNEDVEFYITDKGGALLDIFHKKAPNFVAVKPSWIWEVNSKQQWIPTAQFLVK